MKRSETARYKISLKKGYRILYAAMSVFFLICAFYFGAVSFGGGMDRALFGIGFIGISLVFLLCFLRGLTKKCEVYKGKLVYSFLLSRREYRLSDIAFSKEEVEEFSTGHSDGTLSGSSDKVTTFYNQQGKKLFQFGLAYNNVLLLVRDVKNTQKSISNSKKKR